ncbi:hypothetical protein COLU111180_15755 [Cohnella lubricantis]|uniref:DUF6916 domain-containing protein n=1 Tax=Cohnella lubricantis TaxID=2163172 RepID=A0A841TDX2_9BACL|nr:hypothetical protein [Cohnella lubricantis]MBB6678189.1 hypothetical protein [Cohnella lubricantis]MBP2119684.1 hypothetical protein [Cohnella lubricantis]
MDSFAYSDFAAQRNSAFYVSWEQDGSEIELRLTDISGHSDHPERELFSLELSGPPAPALPQRTYRFSHRTLGEGSLFMVPIARRETGMIYQVIFNRIKNLSEQQ